MKRALILAGAFAAMIPSASLAFTIDGNPAMASIALALWLVSLGFSGALMVLADRG